MKRDRDRGVGEEGENGRWEIETARKQEGSKVGRAIYGGGGGLAVVVDNGEGKMTV